MTSSPMTFSSWRVNWAYESLTFVGHEYSDHSSTPLTRDIIRMGMTSVVADTSRMKQEMQLELLYPTFRHGLALM
jgi:hypothetical protein